jgi:hypothetical protein
MQPMARSQSVKQSLLAQVPKRGREAIATIIEERDGKLTLEQFLAKRWDYQQVDRSFGLSPREVTQRQKESCDQIAAAHPNWSSEQVRSALHFGYLTMDLREVAIARRFTLEDPAELARGLSVLGRLRWIETLIAGQPYADFDALSEAFAARDLAAVQHLAEGDHGKIGDDEEFLALCPWAVRAAYQKDFTQLRSVIKRMRKRKLHPWQEGACGCLEGIAASDATQFASGLTRYVDATRAMRMKDDLEDAIELRAHGLYRLGEWLSPDLVAAADVAQALPWDAGFHAWCQTHPDPLVGVDLTGISPVLHDAVVRLQLPAGWIVAPGK